MPPLAPALPQAREVTVEMDLVKVTGVAEWLEPQNKKENYWWPQMSWYIGSYTSTCNLCLQTKPQCQLSYGQLHLLLGPMEQWSIASVDFIVELSDAYGYNAIMVVVDLYGKRAHFIPTHTTCSAMGAANLYWRNVWKLHGLSDTYILDWEPQFMVEFT
ncbi:hypothetical protein E4T56_gene3469 [Termitomyces sp. T112]|nr:hypothetical protein E4T56_gene3469 [Termitomyces sp. T112]